MPPGPQDLRRAAEGRESRWQMCVLIILLEIAAHLGMRYYSQMIPAFLDGKWPPDNEWWADEPDPETSKPEDGGPL